MFTGLAAKAQQEPQYTLNQFNSNLEINPAYAGANDDASLSLRYRKQWVNYSGSPSTLCFNGESKIIKQRLALGLTVVGDWIGITQSTSVDLSIASHLRIGTNGTLSAGIKIGVQLLKSDFAKLSNVDMTDPLYITNSSLFMPYAGFGLLYHTPKFYVGFAVPQVVSFENVSPQSKIIKPHFFLYGGYRIVLSSNFELRPALLCKYVTAAPFEADIAMDVWFKGVVGLGVSYRTSDAINFMVKGRIGKFYLGYAYDMTITGLKPYNSGTHEIYLGFEFGKKGSPSKKENNRYF